MSGEDILSAEHHPIESGFAEIGAAVSIIASWERCPKCLIGFDGAGPNARIGHVVRCAGGEDGAVRYARAFHWGHERLRDRCDALAEALHRYGQHLAGCPARDARTATLGCRCGLDAALAVHGSGEARSSCPNGPSEEGEWPCDPVDNGDGTATCSVCNWTGGWLAVHGSGKEPE